MDNQLKKVIDIATDRFLDTKQGKEVCPEALSRARAAMLNSTIDGTPENAPHAARQAVICSLRSVSRLNPSGRFLLKLLETVQEVI